MVQVQAQAKPLWVSGLRRKVFPEKHVRLQVNLLQHQKSATIKAECILKAQSQQSGHFPASAKKHYSIEESSCALKKQNTFRVTLKQFKFHLLIHTIQKEKIGVLYT